MAVTWVDGQMKELMISGQGEMAVQGLVLVPAYRAEDTSTMVGLACEFLASCFGCR